MFLLLLIGLGAAVKAQVRIGGNTAPSAAAVLDLNATDAANAGTGGLVLPRVNLTSATMQLTTGVANVNGTMVYDVTATLGRAGVYYWDGTAWVLASLPPTSAVDSGYILMSNGAQWVQRPIAQLYKFNYTLPSQVNIDTYITFPHPSMWYATCFWTTPTDAGTAIVMDRVGYLINNTRVAVAAGTLVGFQCWGN